MKWEKIHSGIFTHGFYRVSTQHTKDIYLDGEFEWIVGSPIDTDFLVQSGVSPELNHKVLRPFLVEPAIIIHSFKNIVGIPENNLPYLLVKIPKDRLVWFVLKYGEIEPMSSCEMVGVRMIQK